MTRKVLALAIGMLVFGAAHAQTLSINSSAVPQTVDHAAPNGSSSAITQSGSLAVTAANSVSCNGGTPDFFHTDNSYMRRFDLDGFFSATGTVTIASVDIGIEQATSVGGTQPITVNLYSIPNASPLTFANLGAPIASASISVTDQATTLLNVPIAAALDGVANDLVMEVFSPNGQADSNTFFIGSNVTPSINPALASSFIAAVDCGINEPTATSSIGFANMNIVMVVNATSLPVTLQGFSVD